MLSLTVDLLEGEPINNDPKVVEKGERDDHGPIVAKSSRGVENKGPIGRPSAEGIGTVMAGITSTPALLLLLLSRVPSGNKISIIDNW